MQFKARMIFHICIKSNSWQPQSRRWLIDKWNHLKGEMCIRDRTKPVWIRGYAALFLRVCCGCHLHQCGIPSLWKCRYVLHQPILPQWAGCLSSDCPDHRDGSRQHTVSFIGCAGRFSVPCHAQAYPKAVLRQAHNVFNNCFPSTVGNESSCMVQGRAEPCR